ncbi:tumor necrosis factor (ligand) superfamily member 13 [Cricetulus griseus]
MPASSPGNMGGSVRDPALSVALWLSWGAVLGAVTCAVALLIQQTELQSLRKEVSRLQRSGGPSQKRGESPWQSLWDQVLFHDVTFTMGQVVSRESQGSQETLFRCIRSMPSDPDRAYNSCYSAGENYGSVRPDATRRRKRASGRTATRGQPGHCAQARLSVALEGGAVRWPRRSQVGGTGHELAAPAPHAGCDVLILRRHRRWAWGSREGKEEEGWWPW